MPTELLSKTESLWARWKVSSIAEGGGQQRDMWTTMTFYILVEFQSPYKMEVLKKFLMMSTFPTFTGWRNPSWVFFNRVLRLTDPL